MNKKITMFFAVALIAASMFTALPVQAETDKFADDYGLDYVYFHGYTTSWDRGGCTDYGYGWAYYDTSGGGMGVTAFDDGYLTGSGGWVYMNSGQVTAIANVNNILVTIWFTNDLLFSSSQCNFEVRLYVNGYSQGLEATDFYLWNSGAGYEQFTFSNLNVQSGDSLDVDVYFSANVGYMGTAAILADFTYVAFST
ncbi:MAG: hypothetical protein NWF01_07120 [Candidatus Bathyarchaeota archaeon]|nr:hypothetical protein [Candidatus Bathyarchaeota archaeon]